MRLWAAGMGAMVLIVTTGPALGAQVSWERSSVASPMAAKKKSKGAIKVTLSGSGTYSVQGKRYRRTASASKSFAVKPGVYRVKAAGATVKPPKVRVRKGRTARVSVAFPLAPTPVPTATPTLPVTPTPSPEPSQTAPPTVSLTRGVTLPAGSAATLDLAPDIAGLTSLTGAQSNGPVSWSLDRGQVRISVGSAAGQGARSVTVTGDGCVSSAQCGVHVSVAVDLTVGGLQSEGGVQGFTSASTDRIAAAVDSGYDTKRYIDEALVLVGSDDTPGTRADADTAAATVGAVVSGGLTDIGLYEVRWATPPADLQAAIDALNAVPGVRAWESTFGGLDVDAVALPRKVPPGEWTLDSPKSLWWWFDQIHAPAAWEVTTGRPRVQVGIVEAGEFSQHTDLDSPDGDWVDPSIHATHVAGLACARANGLFVVGASWGCGLTSGPVAKPRGTKETIDAVETAYDKGARIINMSFDLKYREDVNGDGQKDQPCVPKAAVEAFSNRIVSNKQLWRRVMKAYDDVVFTVAAGNQCMAFPSSPWAANADLANVVSVAATNSNGHLASFSGHGAAAELAAPGGCYVVEGEAPLCGLMSTMPKDQTGRMEGTSMAAPLVAGVANLVWASHPGFTAGEVGACLTSSASTKVAERDDKIPEEIRDPDSTFPVEGQNLYILDAEEAVRCGEVQRVATDKDGMAGLGRSDGPVWSPDGTKIAFYSDASNLVAGDTNGATDVFVKDLLTGAIQRVSTDKDAVQGNGGSVLPSWSPEGTRIAFASYSTNLVSDDTNGVEDVFVKDLGTGQVQRVSVDKNGQQAGADSLKPAWSPDGTKIAFVSFATDLVQGDTNAAWDVFVKDLTSGSVELVSKRDNATQADSHSDTPVWAPDGSKIAFTSEAGNLVEGDTNKTADVFVKDLRSGAVQVVSATSGGAVGNYHALHPVWSPDGTRIAFDSWSTDLVADDTNSTIDVFVKNLGDGGLVRVSTDLHGGQGDAYSHEPSWAPDGKRIAFASGARNLAPDTINAVGHILVKDLKTGVVGIASRNVLGELGDNMSEEPVWAPVGNGIAFGSYATNLSDADTDYVYEIFVKRY